MQTRSAIARGCFIESCYLGIFCTSDPWPAIDYTYDAESNTLTENQKPVIDFYFASSFYNSATVFDMPMDIAKDAILQGMFMFQARAGTKFQLRYAGYGDPDPQARDTPYIVVRGTNDCDDGSACAIGYSGAEPYPGGGSAAEFRHGDIWFVRDPSGNQGMRRTIQDTLFHEIMHVLKFEHQDDSDCPSYTQDDDSVVRIVHAFSVNLTRADIVNLRSSYGHSTQTVRWRRSSPFSSSGWSAPESLTGEVSVSAPAAVNGFARNHGVSYGTYSASNQTGRPNVVVYENSAWQPAAAPFVQSSFRKPDLAAVQLAGSDMWVALAQTDEWNENSYEKSLSIAYRLEGSAGWNNLAPGDVSFARDDDFGIAWDPISGKVIIAYAEESSLMVRTWSPSNGAFGVPESYDSLSIYENFGTGGYDVACSARLNQTVGANCVVATLTAGANPVEKAQLRLVYFKVLNGVPMFMAERRPGILAHAPPQVVANPTPLEPQFQFLTQRAASVDEWRTTRFWTQRSDSDALVASPSYIAASSDWQYPPVTAGTHIYAGNAYNDLVYSLDYE